MHNVDLVACGEHSPFSRSLSFASGDRLGEVGRQQLLLDCPILVVTSPDPLSQSRYLVDILALI